MTQTTHTTASPQMLTGTMRAAVVTEFRAPLQISQIEVPTPGYGEALVKLEAGLAAVGSERLVPRR